jgi:hypothetical protein
VQHCSPQRGGPRSLTTGHPVTGNAEPATLTVELTGGGFLPGENVAIAAVIRETRAEADGRAHAVVEQMMAARGVTEVILFGTTSGTLVRGGIW